MEYIKKWINPSIITTVKLIRNFLINQNRFSLLCATKIISFFHMQNFFLFFLRKNHITPTNRQIGTDFPLFFTVSAAIDAVHNQGDRSVASNVTSGAKAVHRDVKGDHQGLLLGRKAKN